MIKAIVFDLDGVLVQTEKLKALSYAIASQSIKGLPEPDSSAIEAYKEIVGAPRNDASRYIMEKLELENDLCPLMTRYQASEPWEVLTAIRMSIYSDMVADPQILRDNKWPHTIELLRTAKETACLTALVTNSKRSDSLHVVHSLGIEHLLNVIITAEEVKQGKPDPEIYLLAINELGVSPEECLAIEDSVNGVRAALAAGIDVVAIATPFTNAGLHSSKIVDDVWIVHTPEELPKIVRHCIEKSNNASRSQ